MKLSEYKTKTQHCFRDEQGRLQGEYKSWYESGQQCEAGHHRGGVRRGKWESWYPNGRAAEVSHYRDSKLHGEIKRWNWMGELVEHMFLVDGKEIISFLKNPELCPTTPEEELMFALKYGNAPFIREGEDE